MVTQVDPLDLEPGQWVDGWCIVRRIGRGGYAVVYEVEKDGQRFALKVACLTERSSDPKQVDARARREVACLQQLNHRHIIRMWAHGRWPGPRSGFLYIVLDFVDGYTLAQWVEQTHPTPHEAAVLFLKLFDALEHMHGRGVFHRDLSLRNIMVSKDGEPVIIDFGAADYATAEELTNGPLPPGTPRNRSPEAHRFWAENQFNPEARYAFKATDDIFALGANLYDVLTCPTPSSSERRPPLGHPVMAPPTPHKATQGRVPPELSRYAMMLIHPKPEERPATAKDARRPLEELARFEGEAWRGTPIHPIAAQLPPEPAEAAPAPAAASVAEQSRSRRAWLRPVFAGPLALVVLAGAVAAFLLHSLPMGLAVEPSPGTGTQAEKPTNRPTQLPSAVPTQQEASPSVKQPDNSPTLVPNPPQGQKATRRGVLPKAGRCALLVASVAWLEAGCTGVQTRPDPEPCPEEAIKAMQALEWKPGWREGPPITIDVTKPHPDLTDEERTEENVIAVFKDGPVTGAVLEDFGKTPKGTRLDGHLWTTAEKTYGRYVRAHLPSGRTVPICLELSDGGDDPGADNDPGSKPGAAVTGRAQATNAVERWR